jgi:CubicO group peptidase (beta-lactamase class C family)
MFKTIVIHVYCFMSPCTDLSTQLEAIRARYGLPSLSAALIYEGQLGDVAAVGLRASNKLETVTLEDAYQLGSISKGFTATMIARLVEQGILRFDMTLGEVLPDVSMLPEYKSITLQLLLTHRSGIQRDVKPPEGEVQSARKSYLEMALKGPRGQQKFVYSNVGFVIAAIIAERMTGRIWEDLIRQEIFVPLGMEGCSFGFATSNDPVAHIWLLPFWRKYQTLSMFSNTGSSAVLNGAGGIRCPLTALSKYALAHLYHSSFLKPETWKYLHHDPYGTNEYAFGWIFGTAPGSIGSLGHDGSDGFNYARMIISPSENMAVLAATNVGMTVWGRSLNRTMRAINDTVQTVREIRSNRSL